ncbi:MAG: hypothetical protein ACI9CE_002809 [Flavobacterium sp.]
MSIRKSIYPLAEDDWNSIAERELSSMPKDEAVSHLQSWNLHVFKRPVAPEESPRAGNTILPADIIFLEPPLLIN